MLGTIKQAMLTKGMKLMQSPAVGRLMESEKFATILEKAMTVPIKASNTVAGQRERLVALFDLATRDDLDDLRRTLSRMEDVMQQIREESGELLRGVDREDERKGTIAE